MNRFHSILLTTAMISILCTGCSIFVPTKQSLTVTASERDAQIYVNGNYVGDGQIQTNVKRNRNVAVLVKKDGFYPAQRSIDRTMSAFGIADLIGGCCILVPFFGILAPGAWELQEENITVLMEPITNKRTND